MVGVIASEAGGIRGPPPSRMESRCNDQWSDGLAINGVERPNIAQYNELYCRYIVAIKGRLYWQYRLKWGATILHGNIAQHCPHICIAIKYPHLWA